MGLLPAKAYLQIFREIDDRSELKLKKVGQGFILLAPYAGFLSQLVYGILSRVTPNIAPYEWGPVVNLLFLMPPIGYMIVSASGWIALRWKNEYRKERKLQFYRISNDKSYYALKY